MIEDGAAHPPGYRWGIVPFAYGNLANLSSSIARGGLQFMLIIWLQGIWLPLHGYSFEETPLWSAIFKLPLTVGFLIAGPVADHFSDRLGSTPFAVSCMALGAFSFIALIALPSDFSYDVFATLLFANGFGSGLFVAPHSTQIMNGMPLVLAFTFSALLYLIAGAASWLDGSRVASEAGLVSTARLPASGLR